MVKELKIPAIGIAALLASVPAHAQVGGQVNVEGFVTNLCFAGTLQGGNDVFDLGILSETSSGRLRSDLAAPPKTLVGAFCSGASTLSITATPLVSQNFTSNAPNGFSRTIHYTAQASGWTQTPATFVTGASTNPDASQDQPVAFAGDIVVAISDFNTDGGQSLRLVSDPSYQGQIVVTLAAAN